MSGGRTQTTGIEAASSRETAPVPIVGVDYAYGPRDLGSLRRLRAAGARFVCRYVSTPGNDKKLTPTEARDLRAAGLAVVVVFESAGDGALGGERAGARDAHSARVQADGCGVPASVPIYFAVDFDARQDQLPTINAYLRGAASGLGVDRTGVYGGYSVVRHALDHGVCRWAWQTLAWSGGRWEPRAHLRQYEVDQALAGFRVDLDHAMAADFGQWGAT